MNRKRRLRISVKKSIKILKTISSISTSQSSILINLAQQVSLSDENYFNQPWALTLVPSSYFTLVVRRIVLPSEYHRWKLSVCSAYCGITPFYLLQTSWTLVILVGSWTYILIPAEHPTLLANHQ